MIPHGHLTYQSHQLDLFFGSSTLTNTVKGGLNLLYVIYIENPADCVIAGRRKRVIRWEDGGRGG